MKNFLEKSKLPKLTKEKIENLKKTIPLDNLIWQSKISVFHMDMCTHAHTHKYTKQKGPQVFYREVLPTLKGQVILILNYSIVKEKKERLPTDFMMLLWYQNWMRTLQEKIYINQSQEHKGKHSK